MKGLYAVVHHCFRAQADPEKPSGTLVYISGGGEALLQPGFSDASVSKLAAHRVMEYLHLGMIAFLYDCGWVRHVILTVAQSIRPYAHSACSQVLSQRKWQPTAS